MYLCFYFLGLANDAGIIRTPCGGWHMYKKYKYDKKVNTIILVFLACEIT